GTWRVSAIPPGRPPLPLSRNLERSLRSPALWRRGEVQLDRLSAGTRARLDGELSGVGLKDQRRDLFGAVDADPSAEQPAARAVATRLVRCQSEALAHDASTLAAARSIRCPQEIRTRSLAKGSAALFPLPALSERRHQRPTRASAASANARAMSSLATAGWCPVGLVPPGSPLRDVIQLSDLRHSL